MYCKYCGSDGFYLESKGNHVGLYCRDCHKWLKWVGKKELQMYKKSGLIVHSNGSNKETNQSKKENNDGNYSIVGGTMTTGCPTCLSHGLEEIEKVDKSLMLGVKDKVLGVFLNGDPLGFYKVNFCPTCGKGLK